MERIKSLMLQLIIVIISCYILINLALYVFQDYFIFFPRKIYSSSNEAIKYKEYEIKIYVDDLLLHGWLLNRGQKKLIIYYGGNAEEVSANIPDMEAFNDYSILLMNYRGYGLSEGKPGEKALFSDALYIYDYVTDKLNILPEDIVLFGRSLGSGVAVYVAGKRKVSKIILVSPFDSIRNVAGRQFPIIPVGLILKHPFNSMLHAKNVTSPSLLIMGGRDRTIPNSHSINLARNWRGDCKTILIEEAGHNDIHTYREYWKAIAEFLNQ